MAWPIDPVITPLHGITSRTITWHHAMTTPLPRVENINDPTAGATKTVMLGIETGTGAIIIAAGDDIKSAFFSSFT